MAYLQQMPNKHADNIVFAYIASREVKSALDGFVVGRNQSYINSCRCLENKRMSLFFQMRDFLFDKRLDIVSLNINRGRDHGFQSYVEYRYSYFMLIILD